MKIRSERCGCQLYVGNVYCLQGFIQGVNALESSSSRKNLPLPSISTRRLEFESSNVFLNKFSVSKWMNYTINNVKINAWVTRL